ncbi:hypothetical protein SDC9_167342 [bioreactor metagenome]|uniref:Uncharacterized protein n=1 Tax=bioreactor metagenome TaxID=1076179 RepID=A0A645FZI4_9ZZZZ
MRDFIGRPVTTDRNQYKRHQSEYGGNLYAPERKILVPLLDQVPAAYPHHERGAEAPRRGDRMKKLVDGNGRSGHRPEVDHLVPHGLGVELHPDGILHPGVRHQDPERRQSGPEGHQPGRSQVHLFAYPVPPEKHDGNERCFEEERYNTFNG